MRIGTSLALVLSCVLVASTVLAAPTGRPEARCATWISPSGWRVTEEQNVGSGFHVSLLNEEASSFMQLHGSHPRVPPAFLLGEYAQILINEGFTLDGDPVTVSGGLVATYVRSTPVVDEAIVVGARVLDEKSGLSALVVVTGPSWSREENEASARAVMTSLRPVRP